MKTLSTSFVCLAILAQAAVADAAALVFDKTDAVAEARRDPGTGICGSVTKFVAPPLPVANVDEATTILNKPITDSNILNRTSRLFAKIDFSVGPGSEGDFTAPAYNGDIFPFCDDPGASPRGADDTNLAMRVRGYFNVTNTNQGQPITFALRCDDGCVLRMGKSNRQLTQVDARGPLTKRRARVVSFTDPGLYPVEIIYYQNATTGNIEWSQAPGSVFGSDEGEISDFLWGQALGQFKPIPDTQLYSAVVGSNPSCSECGAPGMDCTTGNYCGSGLCQACNVSEHCGASCTVCPSTRSTCAAGKCVQCVGNRDCAVGELCDTATGSCLPPQPCSTSAQCQSGTMCQSSGFCGNADTVCRSDQECRTGEICSCPDSSTSCAVRSCQLPPAGCSSDAQCSADELCDTTTRSCIAKPESTGCSCQTGGARRVFDGWLFALAFFAGLGVFLRRRANA